LYIVTTNKSVELFVCKVEQFLTYKLTWKLTVSRV